MILGDCITEMKLIKDHSVNLVLTDPPYVISRKNNFKTMGRSGIDFGDWDKDFDMFSYIDEIPRILSKNGSVIIFNDWKNIGEIAKYCESVGLVIKDMLRWKKTNPMPRNRNRRYITDYEVAIWCTNKKAKWVFNSQSEKYQIPEFKGGLTKKSEKVGHMTQKPIWLIKDILSIHSDEGDVILDMFAGSGTTGVACLEMGRHFIMIEKDESMFTLMKQRIEEKQLEKSLKVY